MERLFLFVGNDVDDVFIHPLLIGRLELFLEQRFLRLLLLQRHRLGDRSFYSWSSSLGWSRRSRSLRRGRGRLGRRLRNREQQGVSRRRNEQKFGIHTGHVL